MSSSPSESPHQSRFPPGKELPTERRARSQTQTALGRSSPPLCPCRRFAPAGGGGGGRGSPSLDVRRPRRHPRCPVVVDGPAGGRPVASSRPPLAASDRWSRRRRGRARRGGGCSRTPALDCLLLATRGRMRWPPGNTFAPAGGPFLTPPAGASRVHGLGLRGQTASPGSSPHRVQELRTAPPPCRPHCRPPSSSTARPALGACRRSARGACLPRTAGLRVLFPPVPAAPRLNRNTRHRPPPWSRRA